MAIIIAIAWVVIVIIFFFFLFLFFTDTKPEIAGLALRTIAVAVTTVFFFLDGRVRGTGADAVDAGKPIALAVVLALSVEGNTKPIDARGI